MIDKIEEYLQQIGVVVEYLAESGRHQYCHKSKTISMYTANNDTQQLLFSLLHESGHAVLRNSKNHRDKFPSHYQLDPTVDQWITDLLGEEYGAWQVGYDLAHELEIEVNTKEYERHADKCLNTYRKFATIIDKFARDAAAVSGKEVEMLIENLT